MTTPNFAWSLDFVCDQLSRGQRFRALTVVDVFTREALAIEVGQQLRAADVVSVLERPRASRGCPQSLSCDNGSEFTSQLVDLWASNHKIRIDYSRPGNPRTMPSWSLSTGRSETSPHWFESIGDARGIAESWRVEYNESRPHRALGEVPPAEFARRLGLNAQSMDYQPAEDSHSNWH